jgi:hypothetical protein
VYFKKTVVMVFRAFLEQRRCRPRRGGAHLGSLLLHGAMLLALALAARRLQQSEQAAVLLAPPVLAVTLMGPPAAPGAPGPRGAGAAAASRPSLAAPAAPTARRRSPHPRRPALPRDRPAPAEAPATAVTMASEPPAAPGMDGPVPIGLALGGADGDGDGGGGGSIRGRRQELFARVIGGGVAPESAARRDRRFLTVKEATALRTQDYFPRLPAALWPERAPYIVVIELCVSEQGRVSEAELLSRASERLDPVVLTAVRGWRYRPLLEGGTPRPFCHGVVIKYERHY